MSNSYRHTPITGNGSSKGQKHFKKQEHGRERASVRVKINKEQWEQMPHPERYGNEWDSPRDGKCWFGKCEYAYYQELMRK